MRKLYEIFKDLKIQKRIVSAETILGNTVCAFSEYEKAFEVHTHLFLASTFYPSSI